MRIGVLTSSRADYGIYLPLLKELKADDFFELKLVVFGTHLSKKHGFTYDMIRNDGFTAFHCIETVPAGDQPSDISGSMGDTMIKFSSFWNDHKNEFDYVFCLGDRYEMFAAACAAVPFNIKFAHIHGGEKTQGAIDNIFRHSLTMMACLHFTSLEAYSARIRELKDNEDPVYSVGALSLDNLKDLKVLSKKQLQKQFNINIEAPSILVTFHPETIKYERNTAHVTELISVLALLSKEYTLVISMPNADTMGNHIREKLNEAFSLTKGVYLVENMGTQGYFSCLKHVKFILGNSSSGIIEAASFGKYVINIGDRQKGRLTGKNVFQCPIIRENILECVRFINSLPEYSGGNIYDGDGAAKKIVVILKSLYVNE